MTWRKIFQDLNAFQKTAIITITVTFFLIFIGGLVRATGAGLGCPDWPRCFGLWVPPLSVADLPEGYDPEQFNVFKTWMEYFNRLIGVLVGFLILLTFVMSTRYIKLRPSVFAGSLASLILVLFQGWLGGQVVQSGLDSWMISVHMVVAILILNMLLWTVFQSLCERVQFDLPEDIRKGLPVILISLIIVTLVQVVLGTQVREGLEAVRDTYPALARGQWLAEVGLIDTVHRSFSWFVLIPVAIFQYVIWKYESGPYLPILALITTAAILLQIAIGVGLAYMDIPPVLQLLHLWIAALVTAVPFLALLFVLQSRKRNTTDINHVHME